MKTFAKRLALNSYFRNINSFQAAIIVLKLMLQHVSGIGAVVKVVDSHLCGWGSIPSKSCNFLIVSLSKGLSLCFMCSDQHVKYWMPRGLSLTSSLLLDYHVKQYVHAKHKIYKCILKHVYLCI